MEYARNMSKTGNSAHRATENSLNDSLYGTSINQDASMRRSESDWNKPKKTGKKRKIKNFFRHICCMGTPREDPALNYQKSTTGSWKEVLNKEIDRQFTMNAQRVVPTYFREA